MAWMHQTTGNFSDLTRSRFNYDLVVASRTSAHELQRTNLSKTQAFVSKLSNLDTSDKEQVWGMNTPNSVEADNTFSNAIRATLDTRTDISHLRCYNLCPEDVWDK